MGFTRVLTKPIKINELISTLSDFLNHDSKIIPDKSSLPVNEAILKLKTRFIEQLKKQVDEINAAIKNNNQDVSLAILHKIKGTGGSLGLPEISKQAENISELIINNDIENRKNAMNSFARYVSSL